MTGKAWGLLLKKKIRSFVGLGREFRIFVFINVYFIITLIIIFHLPMHQLAHSLLEIPIHVP